MKKIIIFTVITVLLNACKNEVKKREDIKKISKEKLNYLFLGKQKALVTKKVLGKNLKGKMVKEGVLGALQFCNIKANVLTDSMSVVKKAIIRRVSDKNRNIANAANKDELGYISSFKKMIADEISIKPIIKNVGSKVTFYAPIITNRLCLQCHGTLNKEITLEVYKEIQKLYPNDKAVGYGLNEVRGIWVITYNK